MGDIGLQKASEAKERGKGNGGQLSGSLSSLNLPEPGSERAADADDCSHFGVEKVVAEEEEEKRRRRGRRELEGKERHEDSAHQFPQYL